MRSRIVGEHGKIVLEPDKFIQEQLSFVVQHFYKVEVLEEIVQVLSGKSDMLGAEVIGKISKNSGIFHVFGYYCKYIGLHIVEDAAVG